MSGLRLLDHDEPGFWEQNGYHDRGDPIAYTRQAPPGAERPPERLSVADLAPAPRPDATVYVCGSARFADAASRLLVDAGVAVERIRVERFGPTG